MPSKGPEPEVPLTPAASGTASTPSLERPSPTEGCTRPHVHLPRGRGRSALPSGLCESPSELDVPAAPQPPSASPLLLHTPPAPRCSARLLSADGPYTTQTTANFQLTSLSHTIPCACLAIQLLKVALWEPARRPTPAPPTLSP